MNERVALIAARCPELAEGELELVAMAFSGELISLGSLRQVWQMIDQLQERVQALSRAPPEEEAAA
jgi:hypothetical protein